MNDFSFPYGESNRWRPPEEVPNLPPSPLRDWLLSEDSLTRKLKACCDHFEVRILGEKLLQPADGEYAGCVSSILLWTREVLLCLDGVAWVFARTLIPNTLMTNLNTGLHSLGSRPLGELLYSNKAFVSGNIEISCFDSQHKLAKLATALSQPTDHALWGRRRYFTYQSQTLVVGEIFLPAAERAIKDMA